MFSFNIFLDFLPSCWHQDKGLKVFLEKNLKEDNDFVSNPNFLSISKKLEFFDMG